MRSVVVYSLIATLAAPSVSFAGQETTWSKIRRWKPGAEVTLWTSGSQPTRRYVIRSDDDAVTFLNVSNPALPSQAAGVLRPTVVAHPEYFPVPEGKTLELGPRVSLSTSGLFVAGRKVAEYEDVVERIERADVENGTVLLQLKQGMRTSSKVMVGVAIGLATFVLAIHYSLGCRENGCH